MVTASYFFLYFKFIFHFPFYLFFSFSHIFVRDGFSSSLQRNTLISKLKNMKCVCVYIIIISFLGEPFFVCWGLILFFPKTIPILYVYINLMCNVFFFFFFPGLGGTY